jgi:flagellar assembly protein FliH
MSDRAFSPVNMVDAYAPDREFQPTRSEPIPDSTSPSDAIAADDPYVRGFEDGQNIAFSAFDVEKAQLNALMATAAALQSEPSEELAVLIAHTVERLVQDIVGNAQIDRDWLNRKASCAADIVAACDDARTMWLHPCDLDLINGDAIGLQLMPDPDAPRGSIRIDCSVGWIEHGTALYLEELQNVLGLKGETA